MIRLIPAVKELERLEGTLEKRAIFFDPTKLTPRLCKAFQKHFTVAPGGVCLSVTVAKGEGEGYELTVTPDAICVSAESEQAAFFALQTLRQLFTHDEIPCVKIKDRPDFKYRGFYHDVTRGKVPTTKTLKKMIDVMAYYKMNALQLYVEHVFEFKECAALNPKTSYLSAAELHELDAYCYENFIDFQPSLSTFGHMFELLDLEENRHLRVLKDYENDVCRWDDRMHHHTIDPSQEESLALVSSLIDQYEPHFSSKFFNICCDETFDLKNSFPHEVVGKLYIDFVKKIIAHVQGKGKTVMMWADILLQHPEYITELPEDTVFLNWSYRADPPEENVAAFAKLGKGQIVCPGTTSWSRFCERVEREEANIITLADYGYKYGAVGMLNTNWGDWGNPASIDSSLYGLVLGAAKSWAIDTKPCEEFYADVNALLYENPNAMSYLRAMSDAHIEVRWNRVMRTAYNHRNGMEYEIPLSREAVEAAQKLFVELSPVIAAEDWQCGDFKQEFLLSLEGICVLAEMGARLSGYEIERVTNTEDFLTRYRAKWTEKNKESELSRIEDIFRYCDGI